MATAARQGKQNKKPFQDSGNLRRNQAWGNRSSPAFNASSNNTHRPPINGQNGAVPSNDAPPNGSLPKQATPSVPTALAGLVGALVVIHVRSGPRYEGTLASVAGENGEAGVTLKDVKDQATSNAPPRDSVFVAAATLEKWEQSKPHATTATKAPVSNGDAASIFKTDTEITNLAAPKIERELLVWADDDDELTNSVPLATPRTTDEVTFGSAMKSRGQWDQFAANEKLFGIQSKFDEDVYTTRLDRSGPDFRERERKAQRLADEIQAAATNNPHLAEERGQRVDDNGLNEEDKFGAVVRGPNAYVPPAARRANSGTPPASASASVSRFPAGVSSAAKQHIPKVAVNNADATLGSAAAPANAVPKSAPVPAGVKPPADPLPAFRDFVANEKTRLTQKRQAIQKSEMDKRKAELLKFSQNFKLAKPVPEDLVPILTKDVDKQRAIKEKSVADAESNNARKIAQGTSSGVSPGTRLPPQAAAFAVSPPPQSSMKPSPSKPAAQATPKKQAMIIQAIPPFKGTRSRESTAGSKDSNGPVVVTSTSAMDNTAAFRMNSKAPTFKPNPGASSFKPVNGMPSTSSASSPSKPAEPTGPNPFFGVRALKKGSVNIKDDFNPFKHSKVAEPTAIGIMWQYTGKKFNAMFPIPNPPQMHHQPMIHPGGPQPQPPFEQDPNLQQAAQAGYAIYYSPYGYAGQPMMSPMPPGAAPPGQYMQPFMQPMQYSPGMTPGAPPMAYSPGMPTMPPPQQFMQGPPPPGAYPPPNGGPRPSMPPTPIPAHAHPYYHHSPQLQHAVPYPMMMAPPQGPNGPPIQYDGAPPPGGPMGHA